MLYYSSNNVLPSHFSKFSDMMLSVQLSLGLLTLLLGEMLVSCVRVECNLSHRVFVVCP